MRLSYEDFGPIKAFKLGTTLLPLIMTQSSFKCCLMAAINETIIIILIYP